MAAKTAPPRQRDFLEKTMHDKLDEIKFTDLVTAEASGPQLVPTEAQGLQVGWQLTVWLSHNRLLGQGPVGVTVPVPGLDLPAEFVKMITGKLLEMARERRHQAEQPPATPDANQMMEAIRRNSGQGMNGKGALP